MWMYERMHVRIQNSQIRLNHIFLQISLFFCNFHRDISQKFSSSQVHECIGNSICMYISFLAQEGTKKNEEHIFSFSRKLLVFSLNLFMHWICSFFFPSQVEINKPHFCFYCLVVFLWPRPSENTNPNYFIFAIPIIHIFFSCISSWNNYLIFIQTRAFFQKYNSVSILLN